MDGDFKYWKSTAPAEWGDWSTENREAYLAGIEYADKEAGELPTGYASWSADKKEAFQKGRNITFAE